MTRTLIISAFAAVIAANGVYAAPIGAFSELEMSHSFVVNSGNSPEGIKIDNLSSTYEIEVGTASSVDDPTAVPSEISDAQVGNPFTDPPLPFIFQRTNATRLPGGFEGAASRYNVAGTMQADPDDNNFDITRRSIEQEGSASAILLDDTIAASATSFYRSGRSFVFTNTTGQLISFNIAGQFDAMLRAEYTGDDGLARVAGGFELEFVAINGASFSYFPVSPYLTTIEDTDPNAIVSQNFEVSDGEFGRLMFDASASATGTGGTTLASFEGSHRYVLGLNLEPDAQVLLRTSYTQANSVEYTPLDVATVPLPAGGLLLLSGVFGFAVIRRRAKPFHIH